MVFTPAATHEELFICAPALKEEERPALTDAASSWIEVAPLWQGVESNASPLCQRQRKIPTLERGYKAGRSSVEEHC
jgi:hypothetical protein